MITDSVQVPESEVKVYNYDIANGIIVWMDCGGSNAAKINQQFLDYTGKGIVRMIATTRLPYQGSNAWGRAEELGKANGLGKRLPLAAFDLRYNEGCGGVMPGDYLKALRAKALREEIVKIQSETGISSSPNIESLQLEQQMVISSIRSRCSIDDIIGVRKKACSIWLREIYNEMDANGISHNIPMFAAGGMALLSAELVNAFNIQNVHPGDLTKYSLDGTKRCRRTIVGDGWIPPARAIAAGHEMLYSSMHTMVPDMDAGPVHMRGYPLPIDYNWLMSKVDIRNPKILKQVGGAAQETLKHIGDHVIAGATFLDLFDGMWGMHEPTGMLAYRTGATWNLAPNGITIEDHVHYRAGRTPFKRDEKFLDEKIGDFYMEVEKISRGGR